jgi:hypothetical protein
MEKLKHQTQALIRERGIIPWTFITKKCVRAIHLVPGEARTDFLQTGFD